MYYTKYTGPESVSIVNALAEMGENSSYANRKLIAAANGIADYSGTATQNLLMLSLLKDGKLIKPGTDAPAQPENTAEPTKQGFGLKVLIGALVLGAGIAAYKMFGNDEPKTATKKMGKKKATKKKSRKGLNGTKKSKFEKNVDELRNILLRSKNVDEAKQKAEAKGWKCKKFDYSGFDALKARKGLTVCEVFCEIHGSIARWHNIQMVQNTKTTPIEGL